MRRLLSFALVLTLAWCAAAYALGDDKLNTPPEGFELLFNGKDLTNWQGLMKDGYDNPAKRATLTPEKRQELQAEADANAKAHWHPKDGILVFDGKGRSLQTVKEYKDFELYCDWKIEKNGDSGLYLRGTPQVQIWDPEMGGQNAVGSGGLFNNQKHPSKPLVKADKPVGEWNTFYIKMVGEKVTVKLNGVTVVEDTVLENYWERNKPVYASGPIELQNHGNTLYFRNIYIKELK